MREPGGLAPAPMEKHVVYLREMIPFYGQKMIILKLVKYDFIDPDSIDGFHSHGGSPISGWCIINEY